jgi:hypothetical protein
MKIKGELVFVLVVLFFLSCSQAKGLDEFQKIALGSWMTMDERNSWEITEDKIKFNGNDFATYRFDKSKIYLYPSDRNENQVEVDYNILTKDSFTVSWTGTLQDGTPLIEFKIIDKNTASISSRVEGADVNVIIIKRR